MSSTLSYEICEGEMPTSERSRNKGSSKYQPLLDALVRHQTRWAKVGPFDNKPAAESARCKISSLARSQGFKIATSIMPDLSLNVRFDKYITPKRA